MKIDTKDLFVVFPQLAKNPSLAVALFALTVPMVLLYSAAKFVTAPVESLIVFGLLSVVALIYSAWVFSFFKGGSNVQAKENA